MAWCLALGILDSNLNNNLNQPTNDTLMRQITEKVAENSAQESDHCLNEDFLAYRYRDWHNSDPFDIGNTIQSALWQFSRPVEKIN